MREHAEDTAVLLDALELAGTWVAGRGRRRTSVVGGGHLIDPAAPEVLAFVEEVLA